MLIFHDATNPPEHKAYSAEIKKWAVGSRILFQPLISGIVGIDLPLRFQTTLDLQGTVEVAGSEAYTISPFHRL